MNEFTKEKLAPVFIVLSRYQSVKHQKTFDFNNEDN